MWGWQCDRQTDKQATDRQATSVLATSDLKVKLGFDCLCEDRGTFGRRQASGRQAARYHSQWVRFFAQEAFFGFVAKFYARQEDRQAGRRQSGDRRTDRQATDRQATSVLATGDLEIKLDLTVFVKFHSRVSLSSYRMKFVWPESIQGLGQHAGKLNLEIDCTFAGWV
jgi:hypothetical protein